jgi:hypothetical protein
LRSCAVVIITLTFAMILMAGCSGNNNTAGVRILGLVVDDGSLDPIEGARVVAGTGGVEGLTEADGTFDVDGVSAGANITVTASGYQNVTVALAGRTGEVDLGTIQLIPSASSSRGKITGIITLAGGDPAAGATVRAGDRTAVTRADGSYTLYNVATGSQRVYAQSADLATSGSTLVTVVARLESIANIQLGDSPPAPL